MIAASHLSAYRPIFSKFQVLFSSLCQKMLKNFNFVFERKLHTFYHLIVWISLKSLIKRPRLYVTFFSHTIYFVKVVRLISYRQWSQRDAIFSQRKLKTPKSIKGTCGKQRPLPIYSELNRYSSRVCEKPEKL